jgi:hypothetical protein
VSEIVPTPHTGTRGTHPRKPAAQAVASSASPLCSTPERTHAAAGMPTRTAVAERLRSPTSTAPRSKDRKPPSADVARHGPSVRTRRAAATRRLRPGSTPSSSGADSSRPRDATQRPDPEAGTYVARGRARKQDPSHREWLRWRHDAGAVGWQADRIDRARPGHAPTTFSS